MSFEDFDGRPNALKKIREIMEPEMNRLFQELKQEFLSDCLKFQFKCRIMVGYMNELRGVFGSNDMAHEYLIEKYTLYKQINQLLKKLKPIRAKYHTYWSISEFYYPKPRMSSSFTRCQTPSSEDSDSDDMEQDTSDDLKQDSSQAN